MRRFLGSWGRQDNEQERGLSARDIRAIRHAILDAPTPGMQADLMAAATRQGVQIWR